MANLAAFIDVRLDEEEERATPQCVGISGGTPGEIVPNCFNQSDDDGRLCRWALRGHTEERWYKAPEVQAEIRAHQLSHANPDQMRRLAEIGAARLILRLHSTARPDDRYVPEGCCTECSHVQIVAGDRYVEAPCTTLRMLALPWANHPGFDPAWRV